MWERGTDRVLVLFSADPDTGGKTVAHIYRIGRTLGSVAGGAIPTGPATPQTPDITTTAVDLIEDVGRNAKDWKTKYQGKVVQLTGDVSAVAGPGEFMLSAERNPRPGTPAGFSCYVAPDQVGKLSVKAKDRVTVLGTIDFQLDGRLLTIKNSRLVGTPTPGGGTPGTPPGPPTGGVMTVEAFNVDAKKYDGKVVTVSGKVSGVEDEIQPPSFYLEGPGKTKIQCNPTVKGWGESAGERRHSHGPWHAERVRHGGRHEFVLARSGPTRHREVVS